MTNGRLVILSGPSCVGKSPMAKALAKFYPELRKKLQPLVLYNSREARPGRWMESTTISVPAIK
jgi:guanylate kinase